MRSLIIALLAMISMCHATQNTYLPPQNTYVPPYKVGLNNQQDIKTTPRPLSLYSRISGIQPISGVSNIGKPYISQGNTFGSTSNTYQSTYESNRDYLSQILNISGVQSGSYQKPSIDGIYRQNGQGSYSQNIPIISYNNENSGDGNYQFSYETGNNIRVQETGYQQGKTEFVSGSFSYTGPDGVQYSIKYTADENGFHPEGAHLPTPPPIPPEIQRGVELALAAEARGENQDDSYSYGGYPEQHKAVANYPIS